MFAQHAMTASHCGWVLGAAFLTACSSPHARPALGLAQPPETTYVLEPYIWIPSLAGDAPDGQGSPVDVDLVGFDDLKYAFMFSAEAGPNVHDTSLLLDSVYVRFDDDDGLAQIEVGARLLELALAYAPERWHGIELLAGARYWNLRVDFDFAAVTSRLQEESWVDPMVGVRAAHALSDVWSLHARADVGGFGIGADWVQQLQLDTRYRLSKRLELELGYRYLSIEFDDFGFDAALSGPIIALRWSR